MQPLEPEPTFKVYTVIKQKGLAMNYVYVSMTSSVNFGAGFYGTRTEAEQARTLELLKDTDVGSKYHVFELEVPNPVYQK